VSTSVVSGDHSQESHVNLKKKKKCESHSRSDDNAVEDVINSNKSYRHSKRKRTGQRKKAARNECLLDSSPNVETFLAAQDGLDTTGQCVLTSDSFEVQTTDLLPKVDNLEHLICKAHSIQPQTAVHATESVEDSSMTPDLKPTDNQVNDSNSVSDEQQLKLSHSAKRRRRRHRARKTVERKGTENELGNEQSKNISAPVGSLLQKISSSNKLPSPSGHPLLSGFGRTHIVFDNVHSDDESNEKAVRAEPTSQLVCDKYNSEPLKDDAISGSDTVAAESTVKNGSDVEADLHLQNESTACNGFVSCDVKKSSNMAPLPSKPKVYSKARNAAFANVQVFCRQRVKKSDSAISISHDEASGISATLLPKQASICIGFRLVISYHSA